jgi:hypothetical protein
MQREVGRETFAPSAYLRTTGTDILRRYQEGCLSTRCLVILEGKAFFSCRAAVWREDVMAETDDAVPFEGANTLARISAPLPLQRYSQHVGEYSLRELSYQSDALNAFTGIGNAIASSMAHTRMFCGIPAVVFDWAILWRSQSSSLKRRSGFASWSWVGWQGCVLVGNGHTSNYLEHKWLLQRTWIDWSIVDTNGEVVLIWDPERDNISISLFDIISNVNNADGEASGENALPVHQDMEEPDMDSDDADDELCPTYGIPSSGNLCGRQVNSSLIASLPKSLTTPCDPPESRLSPGNLVFRTVVANFTMDTRSTFFSAQDRFFRLYDTAGRVCGLIWEDFGEIDLHKQDRQVREIILLSQAAPGTTSVLKDGRDSRIGFHDEYQFCDTGEQARKLSQQGIEVDGEWMPDWHSWDFFNIMLATPADNGAGVRERVGIGLLHKNALAHAFSPEPSWQSIYLD